MANKKRASAKPKRAAVKARGTAVKPKKKAMAAKPKRPAAKPRANAIKKPKGIAYHERLGLTREQAYLLGITAILIIAVSLFFAFSQEVQQPMAPPAIMPNPNTPPAPQPKGTVLTVITDPSCTFCNKFVQPVEDQVMKAAFSGIDVREISSDSSEAKSLISSLHIKALPAYVFNSHVATEENYSSFKPFLRSAGGNYLLDERTIRDVAIRYFAPPSTDGEPSIGPANATVTIIEFSDPACKACKVFNLNTLPMLESSYNGTARIVFKAMPLSPATLNASIALYCAADQEKFWEYAHAGYEKGVDNLSSLAADSGLNVTRFNGCLSSQKYKDKVMGDRSEAFDYGVTGTPTIFINGIKITGVPKDEAISGIIDAELAQ